MSPNAKKLFLSPIKSGYHPQASDTSIETDVFEFTLLRQRSDGERASAEGRTHPRRETVVFVRNQANSEQIGVFEALKRAMTEAGL
jgi:hypothetical protein